VTEVVIVDDASPLPVSSCIEASERVRIFRLSENRGPSVARNRGVKEARSEFVFFADDDLLIPEDHIKLLLEEREFRGADVCCGVVVEQEGDENLQEAHRRLEAFPKHDIPRGRVIYDLMSLARTQKLIYAHGIFLG
jgi:glycosyltransferase involved in cell wall biosynthesis